MLTAALATINHCMFKNMHTIGPEIFLMDKMSQQNITNLIINLQLFIIEIGKFCNRLINPYTFIQIHNMLFVLACNFFVLEYLENFLVYFLYLFNSVLSKNTTVKKQVAI